MLGMTTFRAALLFVVACMLANGQLTPAPTSSVTPTYTPGFTPSTSVSTTRTPSSSPAAVRCSSCVSTPVSFTGNFQYYQVPNDVNELELHMWGAGGWVCYWCSYTAGSGAYVRGVLPVTGGEVLRLVIGASGSWLYNNADSRFTEQAGGAGCYTICTGCVYTCGGGFTAVQRLNATSGKYVPIAVAGGGGGAAYYAPATPICPASAANDNSSIPNLIATGSGGGGWTSGTGGYEGGTSGTSRRSSLLDSFGSEGACGSSFGPTGASPYQPTWQAGANDQHGYMVVVQLGTAPSVTPTRSVTGTPIYSVAPTVSTTATTTATGSATPTATPTATPSQMTRSDCCCTQMGASCASQMNYTGISGHWGTITVTTTSSPSSLGYSGPEWLFYIDIPPGTTKATFDTLSSVNSFDTVLTALEQCPRGTADTTSLGVLASNDDYSGTLSSIEISSPPARRLYILLDGYSARHFGSATLRWNLSVNCSLGTYPSPSWVASSLPLPQSCSNLPTVPSPSNSSIVCLSMSMTPSPSPPIRFPPGNNCSYSWQCTSKACRSGFCCDPSVADLQCLCGSNGACLVSLPGQSCALDGECSTGICKGGCCCNAPAASNDTCIACACGASAGKCIVASPIPASASPSAVPSTSRAATRSPSPTRTRTLTRTPTRSQTRSRSGVSPSRSRSPTKAAKAVAVKMEVGITGVPLDVLTSDTAAVVLRDNIACATDIDASDISLIDAYDGSTGTKKVFLPDDPVNRQITQPATCASGGVPANARQLQTVDETVSVLRLLAVVGPSNGDETAAATAIDTVSTAMSFGDFAPYLTAIVVEAAGRMVPVDISELRLTTSVDPDTIIIDTGDLSQPPPDTPTGNSNVALAAALCCACAGIIMVAAVVARHIRKSRRAKAAIAPATQQVLT